MIFGIQTYWAQIFILPQKIMKLIEAICRTDIWTGKSATSRKALVAWDKLCQSKAAEGLNIIHMGLWNKVAILKKLYALAKKKDTLAHYYYIKGRYIIYYYYT